MKKKLFLIAVALVVIGAAAGGALYYLFPVRVSLSAAMTRNYILSWSAPRGTTTTELNAAYKGAALALTPAAEAPSDSAGDWPSYNRTLASERYSQLSQINTKNVEKLKVSCTYDIGQFAAFASGLIVVENALIGTTEFDIFSINPTTCAENWRTHEDYPPSLLPANRGPPTWTAPCFAAPRTDACWPMTSRPASDCGKHGSRIRNVASRSPRPPLPGTAVSSSAMRAETSRVARAACTRWTPRRARSSGSSFWFPEPRATPSADRSAPRRSTR